MNHEERSQRAMAAFLAKACEKYKIDIREFNSAEALMKRVVLAMGPVCGVCGKPAAGLGMYLSKHPRLQHKALGYVVCARPTDHQAETTAFCDAAEVAWLA